MYTAQGDSSFPTLLDARPSAAVNCQFIYLDWASKKVGAQQSFSTTAAFSLSSSTLASSTWYYIVVTFTASDQKMRTYIGTLSSPMAEVAYTTQTAGVGTRVTGGTILTVGNTPNQDFSLAGRASAAFMESRLVSRDEMEAGRLGRRPIQSGSLKFFWPLDSPTASQVEDLSGSGVTGTLTGALVAEGPPIPYTLSQPIVVSEVTGPVTYDAEAVFTVEAFLAATGEHLAVMDAEAVFISEAFLSATGELVTTHDAEAVFVAAGFLTATAQLVTEETVPGTISERRPKRLLGCGEYHVQIEPRGGGSPVALVPWMQINFGRVLDSFSNCTIIMPSSGPARTACCIAWEKMEPLEHEIVVYRDGKLAWAGPLLDMQTGDNGTQISGRDSYFWFDRRFLPLTRIFEDDLGDIFNTLAEDALSTDPSPNISLHAKPTGVIGERRYNKEDFVRAGDALSELARTAVDFTMVGRDMYTGGLEILFPDELRMWEPAKRLATLRLQGSRIITEMTIIGKPVGDGQSVISGTATGQIGKYGLVQVREAEPQILERRSMKKAAMSRLEMLKHPPRFLNFSCAPEAPFGMEDLVPGVKCDVRIDVECERLIEVMRLQSIAVNVVQSNDGGVSESIDCTLIPVGVVDGDL